MVTKQARDGNGKYVSMKDKATIANAAAIQEVLANMATSRSEFIQQLIDPRRDINDECGYPTTTSITVDDMRELYDRESIATRVVEVMPKESWKTQPSVFETEDVDNITAFEEAWTDLGQSLRGESWYQDEEGSPIWEHLLRADIQSGIGWYGVLLLGIDDGRDMREPADFRALGTGGKVTRKLLFLRSFDEALVNVTRYDSDPSSVRFGQPETYDITLNDPREQSQGGVGLSTATFNVHWTRVIHVADNLGSSEVLGVPRMRPVFNRLLDLRKLYGGSAEMYWRGAFPGLSVETHPQLGGEVAIDDALVKDRMEDYMNGLQRYLLLMGMSAKSLAPQVVDPTPQIDTQITAICIRLGIPKRIFMGSERGELASSQDEDTWNDRLRYRQANYITPRLIIPFVDRLILMGILPEPEGYSVVWPDLDSLTKLEQADISVKQTEAMTKYVGGNVEAMMTPFDYLVRVIGWTQEEAEAVVEAAMAEEEKITIPEEPEVSIAPVGTGPTEQEPTKPGEVLTTPEPESTENAYRSLRLNLDHDEQSAYMVPPPIKSNITWVPNNTPQEEPEVATHIEPDNGTLREVVDD